MRHGSQTPYVNSARRRYISREMHGTESMKLSYVSLLRLNQRVIEGTRISWRRPGSGIGVGGGGGGEPRASQGGGDQAPGPGRGSGAGDGRAEVGAALGGGPVGRCAAVLQRVSGRLGRLPGGQHRAMYRPISSFPKMVSSIVVIWRKISCVPHSTVYSAYCLLLKTRSSAQGNCSAKSLAVLQRR